MKIRVTTDIDVDGVGTSQVRSQIDPRDEGDEVIIMDNGGGQLLVSTLDKEHLIIKLKTAENRFFGLTRSNPHHGTMRREVLVKRVVIKGDHQPISEQDERLVSFEVAAGKDFIRGAWVGPTFDLHASRPMQWKASIPGYELVVDRRIDFIEVKTTNAVYSEAKHPGDKVAGLMFEF